MQCPAGWDAGTLLLRLSFLHDQSDQSDQSDQLTIPLINYHKPRTNGRAALREQSVVCYRTTEKQPGCGRGQMSLVRLSTCLGCTFALDLPDPGRDSP